MQEHEDVLVAILDFKKNFLQSLNNEYIQFSFFSFHTFKIQESLFNRTKDCHQFDPDRYPIKDNNSQYGNVKVELRTI